jgi:hypothetical protein
MVRLPAAGVWLAAGARRIEVYDVMMTMFCSLLKGLSIPELYLKL